MSRMKAHPELQIIILSFCFLIMISWLLPKIMLKIVTCAYFTNFTTNSLKMSVFPEDLECQRVGHKVMAGHDDFSEWEWSVQDDELQRGQPCMYLSSSPLCASCPLPPCSAPHLLSKVKMWTLARVRVCVRQWVSLCQVCVCVCVCVSVGVILSCGVCVCVCVVGCVCVCVCVCVSLCASVRAVCNRVLACACVRRVGSCLCVHAGGGCVPYCVCVQSGSLCAYVVIAKSCVSACVVESCMQLCFNQLCIQRLLCVWRKTGVKIIAWRRSKKVNRAALAEVEWEYRAGFLQCIIAIEFASDIRHCHLARGCWKPNISFTKTIYKSFRQLNLQTLVVSHGSYECSYLRLIITAPETKKNKTISK